MVYFSENVNVMAGVVLVRLFFFVFVQFLSSGRVETQRDNVGV